MKKCIDCQTLKEYTEFCFNKSNTDGISYYCRSCTKLKSGGGRLIMAAKKEARMMREYARWIAEHTEWLKEYDKQHGLKDRKNGFLPNSYFEEE